MIPSAEKVEFCNKITMLNKLIFISRDKYSDGHSWKLNGTDFLLSSNAYNKKFYWYRTQDRMITEHVLFEVVLKECESSIQELLLFNLDLFK